MFAPKSVFVIHFLDELSMEAQLMLPIICKIVQIPCLCSLRCFRSTMALLCIKVFESDFYTLFCVETTFPGKEIQDLERKLRERREFDDAIGLTAVRGK